MFFARVKQINLCHSFQMGAAPPPARVGEFLKILKMEVITMPKTDRFRALYVLKYLWEHTDEEHPVTLAQVQDHLSEQGIQEMQRREEDDS